MVVLRKRRAHNGVMEKNGDVKNPTAVVEEFKKENAKLREQVYALIGQNMKVEAMLEARLAGVPGSLGPNAGTPVKQEREGPPANSSPSTKGKQGAGKASRKTSSCTVVENDGAIEACRKSFSHDGLKNSLSLNWSKSNGNDTDKSSSLALRKASSCTLAAGADKEVVVFTSAVPHEQRQHFESKSNKNDRGRESTHELFLTPSTKDGNHDDLEVIAEEDQNGMLKSASLEGQGAACNSHCINTVLSRVEKPLKDMFDLISFFKPNTTVCAACKKGIQPSDQLKQKNVGKNKLYFHASCISPDSPKKSVNEVDNLDSKDSFGVLDALSLSKSLSLPKTSSLGSLSNSLAEMGSFQESIKGCQPQPNWKPSVGELYTCIADSEKKCAQCNELILYNEERTEIRVGKKAYYFHSECHKVRRQRKLIEKYRKQVVQEIERYWYIKRADQRNMQRRKEMLAQLNAERKKQKEEEQQKEREREREREIDRPKETRKKPMFRLFVRDVKTEHSKQSKNKKNKPDYESHKSHPPPKKSPEVRRKKTQQPHSTLAESKSKTSKMTKKQPRANQVMTRRSETGAVLEY